MMEQVAWQASYSEAALILCIYLRCTSQLVLFMVLKIHHTTPLQFIGTYINRF